MNTSYLDTGRITVREKELLLLFIEDDFKKQAEVILKAKESKKDKGAKWTNGR